MRVLDRLEREHACKGKIRRKSRGAAEAHLRALEKQGKASSRDNAYLCRFCRGWHVGHSSRP